MHKPLSAIALAAGLAASGLSAVSSAHAQALDAAGLQAIDAAVNAVAPKMVGWRRDIHAHPELSGQEVRTAKLVAEHLKKLGMEVQTNVGGTGVVGTLRGGLPGKVVALRADMDALPVPENTGLPFASKVKANYLGKEVPVMHACGHDAHVAMLMGAAEALAGMKAKLPGTIKFIFQPAEEGAPVEPDATGKVSSFGAKAMVEEGAMKDVQAIYGLHITANLPAGVVGYRSGPLMAGSDSLKILIEGRGGHGSSPWNAVDPVVAASQVVLGLQTVVSRQLNISKEPAVITIGSIQGGTRYNIIPDNVEMMGTLRTFDEEMRQEALKRITTTAESIALSSGAKAKVVFGPVAYPVTSNPAELTAASLPALKLAMGGKAMIIPKVSGSEDFSEFQKVAPGFFYFLGAPPKGADFNKAPSNHSPLFDIDEDQLPVGARSLAALAVDFLQRK
ncbi:N-acyl-L-amino acid amidohydrolase [Acidovorax sp. Root275]|uniref:amidohydrolase n=1 Tax=unclassified Acidovorax TaxID=2684926 RepID=UPI000708FC81|nr:MULTISPECIES: amidohydrolase [unclassified Acidovorax]KRD16434.1 N-acyl-L-amino acid amidohydrolase [Acidovorax sp. Root267]KRD42256.1 N-acyl-L-amino acid amidohydrolase [Acidovorax sp. Root275]